MLHGMEYLLWCLNLAERTPWLRMAWIPADNDIESHDSGNLIWIVQCQARNTRIFLSLFPTNKRQKRNHRRKVKVGYIKQTTSNQKNRDADIKEGTLEEYHGHNCKCISMGIDRVWSEPWIIGSTVTRDADDIMECGR